MKNTTLAFLAFLTLTLPCSADQLYVRNRPFKGAVSSADKIIWVELKPLAEALGATLVDNGKGGYALSMKKLPADAAAEVPENKLLIAGKTVDVQTVGGLQEVPLEATAALVNARVTVNKSLGTIDLNMPTGIIAAPAPPVAMALHKPQASASGHVVHLHGKVSVPGADAVGLFADGSASEPYKTGAVDKDGNYSMDVDLDKDLHPLGGGLSDADVRFYKSGAFGECHGCCNFLMRTPDKKVKLQVYEGPTYDVTNNDLEYTEKDKP